MQSRLSYHEAWILAESPETGAAYNELTGQLRRVAGASMREAWKRPALETDEGMNIGADRVDLSALKYAEQSFLGAARPTSPPSPPHCGDEPSTSSAC